MRKLIQKLLVLLRLKKPSPPIKVQGGGGPGEEGS